MASIVKVDQIQNADGTVEYLNAGTIKNASLHSSVTGGSGITALGTVASAGAITTSNPINFTGPNHTFTVKAVNQPISGTTNSTNDDANSDQLAIYNGSTKLWGISEHGYMLNPTKPYFNVYKDDVTSFTSSTDIVWNQVKYNVTGSYNTSNGRFTAPISGTYFFCFNVLHRGTSYVKGGYQINDTDFYAGSASEFYVDGAISGAHSHVTVPMILE